MTEIKINNPIETLSDAVRVLKAATAKQEKAKEAENEARTRVTNLKMDINDALADDNIDAIGRLNTKLKQAHNAIDRAIERYNTVTDEYNAAVEEAARAMSALKGGTQ